jgi:integrase
MTKTEAREKVAEFVNPVNVQEIPPSDKVTICDFVGEVFLPFYQRKWKNSTASTNEERIRYHILSELGSRTIGSFNREELQGVLDLKASKGLSHSVVNHLRWDLRQIFELATAEGFIRRNPATLLFVPKGAKQPTRRIMNWEEVKKLLLLFELRERLIIKLGVLTGMRPGEIFGLKWKYLRGDHLQVRQRVYRGEVDAPKTGHSVREVALSTGLLQEITEWKEVCGETRPEGWVFPSETLGTPLRKDNVWRRNIAPKLRTANLHWVNFQVMRRTHSSLLSDLKIDPKVVADQLGHTLDVNQNIYTKTGMERRKQAVDCLELKLGNL